ncbi:MAG: bifunctional D-glycero-beta-D-manno-heptose-7-phosphate kinase/D-glycero-beta-D-manno-heptose 1-phosphate adenylyltransferase HldE [Gammaproteobacteria bacterium]|jgi:D-beta-D-heptose 7-phosphate kinase/D-beta-D-heptose 1-phosphate adenosyltransferase
MNIEIPDFSKVRILVVGDLMLDRYWYGQTARISPEAPVPVVKVQNIEERPGGAGNVALNLAALGVKTSLLAITGDDIEAESLNKLLTSAGVECFLQKLSNLPTITKLRVMSQHQQLIRLDFENNFQLKINQELLNKFKVCVKNFDAVILSDYGKGTLMNSKELIKIAAAAKVPVFVDPKQKDFSFYKGAAFITPNFKEFQAAAGECKTEKEIISRAQDLLKTYNLENLLITRGAQGMTLCCFDKKSQHFSTHAREVFDVTGAGDTVIAVLAAAVASGLDLIQAAQLANIAAGIAVSKLGAVSISAEELNQATTLNHLNNIVNEEQLQLAIQDARTKGEKIVFTNGCFDILHAGHVYYLEQAKKLGHRLIVAVNNDNSVKRLKGDNRPINDVNKRMAVLAGLNAVDWVVPFAEDTPERLINELLPDVLVKGGDWKPEEIVGSQTVLQNGGEVKSLNFIDGCSTTSVIDRVKGAE